MWGGGGGGRCHLGGDSNLERDRDDVGEVSLVHFFILEPVKCRDLQQEKKLNF